MVGAGRTVAVVATEGVGIGGQCRKDSSSGRYRRGRLLVVGAGRTVAVVGTEGGRHWWSVQEGQ